MWPIHLPADFPRIANDLSRLWSQMATLDLYLRDKEFNPREDRKGFTPLISKELLAMLFTCCAIALLDERDRTVVIHGHGSKCAADTEGAAATRSVRQAA